MKKDIRIGKLKITPIIVFFAILFIVSAVEFSASYVMELIFHKRWWDYSYDILNLNGRISLRNSSLLALGGMLFVYVIQPILEKIFRKFKETTLKKLAILIISVMSIDLILVIIGYVV